jgi:hypothetical protein
MAAIDLNAIGELLREEFEEPWIEAVDRDNFLLQRFGRTNMDGGAEVRWKVHYAGNPNAGPYSENDVIPTPGAQAYTQARSPIKQNWVAIEASGLAQAATQGSAGFVDLIAEETEQSLEDLKDRINDQLLATTADGTGRSIHGMGYIISDTGVYAGIDRTSNSFWRSFVLANAGTPRALTIPLMQAVMTEMEKSSRKSKISAILTNRKHFYDYGNILTPDRRYTATERLDGGFMAVDFEGLPVVSVPNMPAGAMYFLDESTWSYYVLQNFEVKPKSTNKDSDYFLITHYSNLICKDPRKNAKITDLA